MFANIKFIDHKNNGLSLAKDSVVAYRDMTGGRHGYYYGLLHHIWNICEIVWSVGTQSTSVL